MTPAEMLQQGRRVTVLAEEVARLWTQKAELLEALRRIEPLTLHTCANTAKVDATCVRCIARDAIRRAEEGK